MPRYTSRISAQFQSGQDFKTVLLSTGPVEAQRVDRLAGLRWFFSSLGVVFLGGDNVAYAD
jgi:hypothetical protein